MMIIDCETAYRRGKFFLLQAVIVFDMAGLDGRATVVNMAIVAPCSTYAEAAL